MQTPGAKEANMTQMRNKCASHPSLWAGSPEELPALPFLLLLLLIPHIFESMSSFTTTPPNLLLVSTLGFRLLVVL